MSERTHTPESTTPLSDVAHHRTDLKLACMMEPYAARAQHAAHKAWSHGDSLTRRAEGEATLRGDRATKSRIRLARFPVIKTVDQCRWDWPTRLNRLQGHNHFQLACIPDKANRIFLGGVGLGKTPLATALGYAAGRKGYSVLCARAMDVINTLAAARRAGRLQQARKPYPQPALLLLDALGDLPIDKAGADLRFQVISLRYAPGAIMSTSHRACKEWPTIFRNDSTLTAAMLDRLLHHADTVIIAGKSFRMKDPIER